MMMMMMMMMSVVICDEIYRILFKNNICFSSLLCFLLFLSFSFLVEEKKISSWAKREENLWNFHLFFPFLRDESDVNFTFFFERAQKNFLIVITRNTQQRK